MGKPIRIGSQALDRGADLAGCFAIARAVCGSQRPTGGFYTHTREGWTYSRNPMASQAMWCGLSSRIGKAMFGRPQVVAWTAFATLPCQRFPEAKDCRIPESVLFWQTGMAASGWELAMA
jgi:hypothetical protein